MTLYKNKYRIESARLKGWDYSSDGYYFITICTKNRECYFGDIEETQDPASLQSQQSPPNKFGPQSKNIASIIRGYKIGVTKNARRTINNFAWQPRFYDRIIRDENELNRIRKYIVNNTQNWKKDDHYLSPVMGTAPSEQQR